MNEFDIKDAVENTSIKISLSRHWITAIPQNNFRNVCKRFSAFLSFTTPMWFGAFDITVFIENDIRAMK